MYTPIGKSAPAWPAPWLFHRHKPWKVPAQSRQSKATCRRGQTQSPSWPYCPIRIARFGYVLRYAWRSVSESTGNTGNKFKAAVKRATLGYQYHFVNPIDEIRAGSNFGMQKGYLSYPRESHRPQCRYYEYVQPLFMTSALHTTSK